MNASQDFARHYHLKKNNQDTQAANLLLKTFSK